MYEYALGRDDFDKIANGWDTTVGDYIWSIHDGPNDSQVVYQRDHFPSGVKTFWVLDREGLDGRVFVMAAVDRAAVFSFKWVRI